MIKVIELKNCFFVTDELKNSNPLRTKLYDMLSSNILIETSSGTSYTDYSTLKSYNKEIARQYRAAVLTGKNHIIINKTLYAKI